MHFFANKFIKPFIARRGYRRICEIGASTGENTARILETEGVSLTIIDPCLDADLMSRYGGDERVALHQGLSLEVLPRLSEPFDCFLIDGDHNWYTVYNELRIIEERGLLKAGGAIFFHDVCWPYARRDMYYQPELIPREFIRPYEQKGIVKGAGKLSDDSEFNATHYNAINEDGPRNGVLTAIEDFLKEHHRGFRFFRIRVEFGLGVLLKRKDFLADMTFNQFLIKGKNFEMQLRVKEAVRRSIPSVYASLARIRHRGERAKFS
jgi:Methyltransferase domain